MEYAKLPKCSRAREDVGFGSSAAVGCILFTILLLEICLRRTYANILGPLPMVVVCLSRLDATGALPARAAGVRVETLYPKP